MMVDLLIGAAALAATGFVLAPLFRPDAAEAERVARRLSAEEDLHSQHAMAVASLRDLEDDRATGKLDDADYAAMKGALEAKAIDLMKRIDASAAGKGRS